MGDVAIFVAMAAYILVGFQVWFIALFHQSQITPLESLPVAAFWPICVAILAVHAAVEWMTGIVGGSDG